jgi:hypothetical protein
MNSSAGTRRRHAIDAADSPLRALALVTAPQLARVHAPRRTCADGIEIHYRHPGGVFHSAGRIVETDSLATDPPGSSRDDLVFPGGTIHIISTIVDFSFTINPNCLGEATIKQSGEIRGGTGQLAHAAGAVSATVWGPSLLPRNVDGGCAFDKPALHEADMITASRRIRRELVDRQLRAGGDQVVHQAADVGVQVVPHQDDGTCSC